MTDETNNSTEPATGPEQAEGRDDEPGDTQPLSGGEPSQERPRVPRYLFAATRPP